MRSDIFRQKSKYIRPPFYTKDGGNKRRMYAKGRSAGDVFSVPFWVKMTANRLFSSNNSFISILFEINIFILTPPFDCTGDRLRSNVLWLNPDNQKPTNSMRKGRREKDIECLRNHRGDFTEQCCIGQPIWSKKVRIMDGHKKVNSYFPVSTWKSICRTEFYGALRWSERGQKVCAMDEQEKIKSNSLNSVRESVYGTKLFWAVDMIGNPQESPYNGSKKIYKVFLRKEKKSIQYFPRI